MNYLLLVADVALLYLMWPVNRWVMKRGGRTRAIGLSLTFAGMVFAAAGAVATGQPFFSAVAVLFGSITAVAYDIGFCLIIFYCLKIGPSAATSTLNSLGFMFPILIGIFVFSAGKSPSAFVIAGIVLTFLSLVLMAFNKTDGAEAAASAKWFRLAFIGFLLSGVTLGSQFIATQLSPDGPYTFAFNANLFAFLIMAVMSFAMKDGRPKKDEMLAGAVTGAVNILSTVILFTVIQKIPAYIFYPVIMAAPIVLMLLTGHFIYREKMNRFGWAACLAGVAGLVLFNL